MVHRLAPRACADLDAIWEYVVKESRSEAIADQQIDAMSNALACSPIILTSGGRATMIWDRAAAAFRSVSTSSFIAS